MNKMASKTKSSETTAADKSNARVIRITAKQVGIRSVRLIQRLDELVPSSQNKIAVEN
jgi:hypothetical protein